MTLLLHCSLAWAALAAPAMAWDTTPPDTADASAEQAGIRDIVVTAQRRSESLQRVAVAVSAVNGQALAQAGIAQPQDLSKLIPALQLSSTGGAGTQVTIRGVGNFAGNPYAEPAVAVNLDGVYIARSAGSDGLFYDLDRVEVLKGPQGTLYGRNATAGALNIIVRKPEDTYAASGSVTAGNYHLWSGNLALNAPLGNGSALRVSGAVNSRDGYLSDGYNDDRSQAVRAQLKLVLTDRLTALIAADYAHQGGKGVAGVLSPSSSNPYAGPTADGTNTVLRSASLGMTGGHNANLLPQVDTNGHVNGNNAGVSGTFDYRLDASTLTVIAAYRNNTNDYLHYSAGFPVSAHEVSAATSVETRWTSSDAAARLKWLVGGFFYNEDQHFNLYANQGVSFNRTEPVLNTISLAAFGQATYALIPALRLTGGLRLTHERKVQSGRNGGPLPSVPAGWSGSQASFYNASCAPYDATTATCYAQLAGRLLTDRVTWKAGVEADAGPRSLVYANVGTGFKAGGFFGSSEPNTYKPETLTAYTIGSKNRFFSNTLQLNGEAFYWDYRNQQTTHLGPILPAGFGLITENAGKAEIYGAEVEALWKPGRHDTLSADLQYLHARYKDFTYTQTTANGPAQTSCPTTASGSAAVIVTCTGRAVPLSPTWTVNLAYSHDFELKNGASIEARIGTRIQSGYWTGQEYLNGEYQDSVTTSNATLTWRPANRRLSVSGYVDNIEDNAVKSTAFAQPVVGAAMVILRPPRTYGIRIGFDL